MSGEALRWVLAPNPSPMTLDGTRSWVVGRSRPAVIDPGPDDAGHVERLLELLAGARPEAILLTHHHPDHAGAATALSAATGAPVLMAPGALDVGFPPVTPARLLADGERIETDAGSIRALATPGHVPEHLCFHWVGEGAPAGGALFAGDLVMGVGDTTLVAWPEGDLSAYLTSLRRVAELGPGVLLPAHGPPLGDPREAVARYLGHREARVAAVISALDPDGAVHPRRLVDRVYGTELDPRLRAAAEASLRAILHFLEARRLVRIAPDGAATPIARAAGAERLLSPLDPNP